MFAAAVFVLGASLVVGTERETGGALDPAASAATRAESRPVQQALAKGLLIDLDLARLNRAPTIELENELFAIRVPKAAPLPIPTQAVVQTPPPPPAKPVAPPVPFKYLGQMVDRGQLTVFVARGDELLSLKQGDVVASQYRVDAATEASVTFVYLPLNERQTLVFGSRN
jgi:hypothetical protein